MEVVKLDSNWTRVAGCDFDRAVQTKVTHDDIFLKPELDDLICEERTLLLSTARKNSESAVACELYLRVFPKYKIESFTLVCTASKLEVFLGPQREYVETVYGAIIGDDTNDDMGEPLLSYRYDIEVQKSGIVELTLKLLTASDEICIYGIVLQIAPNPNGITTMLASAIDFDNVQQMLSSSSQKISPSAEKCKKFMEQYNKSASGKTPMLDKSTADSSLDAPKTLLEQMKQVLAPKSQSVSDTGNDDNNSVPPGLPPTLDNIIKSHIDLRMTELENKLIERINAISAEQSEKLDNILKLLNPTNVMDES